MKAQETGDSGLPRGDFQGFERNQVVLLFNNLFDIFLTMQGIKDEHYGLSC